MADHTNHTIGAVTLSNGVEMPWIGLGTWAQGPDATSSVIAAIEMGYRSVDTGSFYQNEADIGAGLKAAGVARSQLFVTTKVWNSEQGFDATLHSFEVSLKTLDLDYIDLYLVHWPVKGKSKETWRALERIYKDGRARAIGVSNFQIHHLEDLMTEATVTPMVNQIDLHPLNTSRPLQAFCKAHGIQVEAWGPLGQGTLFELPPLQAIAERHGRSVPQVILRWHYQNGIVTIPKSASNKRLLENISIFDFTLDAEEMGTIDGLNEDKRLLGFEPDDLPAFLVQPPAAPWPYSLAV
jgi:diketogulonate reductase-like aldo/keto reductase